MSNRRIYANVLSVFCESHAQDAIRLSASLAAHDLTAIGHLAHELPALIDGVRQAGVVGAAPLLAGDRARLGKVLARLESLLEAGDMEAVELVRAEVPLLHATLGEAGDKLLRCVNAYDYEEALALLRAALPVVPK